MSNPAILPSSVCAVRDIELEALSLTADICVCNGITYTQDVAAIHRLVLVLLTREHSANQSDTTRAADILGLGE